MRARLVAIVLLASTAAAADPKPTAIDMRAERDKLVVLGDAAGGTYVALQGEDPKLFYAPSAKAKVLHQQIIVGSSRNGDAWGFSLWAPRLAQIRPASFDYRADGTWAKSCDGKDDAVLAPVSAERAKAVLDTWRFESPALVRRPHLLARDDEGIYYYVDKLAAAYGGKGYRVWVGKKGAMKQVPLKDVASDSAGEVFATHTGDLRLVHGDGESESARAKATWVKGGKRTELIQLDVDVNSPLIFRDLGIYSFLGTLCDNI